MAKYRVTAPNGKTYLVEGPAGASQDEVIAEVLRRYPSAEQPASTERTAGEAVKDIGAGLVQGVGSLVQLPGQLYGLATGDFSPTGVLGAGQRISEYGESMESAGLKARESARAAKVQAAEQEGQIAAFTTAFAETIKDPALLSSFVAEQLPQLVPIIASGGIAAAGAAGRAAAAQVAKGATKEVAAQAARAAAVRAGTTAAVQTGAVMQGADVGASTYDAIYQNVIQRGGTEQEAAEAALNRARAAGVAGYGLSVLANRYLPGGQALEKAIVGQGTGRGLLAAGAAGALKEVPSENVEEIGGALARNIALQSVDPTQSLTQGLGQTAAQATLGAAALGGAAGAYSGRGTAPVAPAPQAAPEAAPEVPAEPEAEAEETAGDVTQIASIEQMATRLESEGNAAEASELRRAATRLRAQADKDAARAAKAAADQAALNVLEQAPAMGYVERVRAAAELASMPETPKVREASKQLTRQIKAADAELISARRRGDELAQTSAFQEADTDLFGMAYPPAQAPAAEEAVEPSPLEMQDPRQLGLFEAEQARRSAFAKAQPDLFGNIYPPAKVPSAPPEAAVDRPSLRADALQMPLPLTRPATPRAAAPVPGQAPTAPRVETPAAEPVEAPVVEPGVTVPAAQGAQNAPTIPRTRRPRGGVRSEPAAAVAPAEPSVAVPELPAGEPAAAGAQRAVAPDGPRVEDMFGGAGVEPAAEAEAAPALTEPEPAGAEPAAPAAPTVRSAWDIPKQSMFTREEPAAGVRRIKGGFYSIVPAGTRAPSLKRRVSALQKKLSEGSITPERFANEVDWISSQVEAAKAGKPVPERTRGADYIRQRLLESKRRGEIDPEAVDLAEWFIQQNPALVDDLGISIRTPREGGSTAGSYLPLPRIMRLFKESGDVTTPVHEILHHLERMMPAPIRAAIRKAWAKEFAKKSSAAKNPADRRFFELLSKAHFAADVSNTNAMRSAIQMVADGEVSPSLYMYVNPSEFWAENASSIVAGRYDAVRGGVLAKLKQWLREAAVRISGALGLGARAPIVQALNSLSKADGKFVSSQMLSEDGPAPTKFEQVRAAQQRTAAGAQVNQILTALNKQPPPQVSKAAQAGSAVASAVQNPRATAATFSKATSSWLDRFGTAFFSSNFAFNRAIQKQLQGQLATNPQAIGMLLATGDAQVDGSAVLAGLFARDGNLQYRPDIYKWESQKSTSLSDVAKTISDMASTHGMSKAQASQVVDSYFEARRTEALRQRNDDLDALAAVYTAAGLPKRAQETLAKKVEHLKDPAWVAQAMQLETMFPELTQVADQWNEVRKNTAKIMVDSGLWTQDMANDMLSAAEYVPFYREEQIAEGRGPKEFMSGLQVRAREARLKGSTREVNDIFDNMMRWTQYAIERSVRNHMAVQRVDAAVQFGLGTQVNTDAKVDNGVKIWRAGQQEQYQMADPLFVDAFAGLESIALPSLKFWAKITNVFRQSVVLNPLFGVLQVPQDAIAAIYTSGLKPRYAFTVPARAVKEFLHTLVSPETNKTHRELRAFGAVGARDTTADVIRMDLEIMEGARSEGGLSQQLLRRAGKLLHHVAMASDSAVRQAVYTAAMDQGMSQAEALEKAFQLINFRNRGTSKGLAMAARVIPFLNAYIAAQHVAYKTLSGTGISPTDRKAALQTLGATTLGMMGLSMIYAMMNGGDEGYEKRPLYVRDRVFVIPGTDGISIPMRADVFAFPKVIAEHMWHHITDSGTVDGANTRRSLRDLLASSLTAPYAPQALKPAVEVAINYDFFRQRPLVGASLSKAETEYQFSDATSAFGKMVGSSGVISPIAVDHLMRGYLGSLGGLVLYTSNQVITTANGVARPDISLWDAIATFPGASSVVPKQNDSALRQDFYELKEAVDRVAQTITLLNGRDPAELDAYLADEDVVARDILSDEVDSIYRELRKIRKDISLVREDRKMTAEEKRVEIEALQQDELDILRSSDIKAMRKEAGL